MKTTILCCRYRQKLLLRKKQRLVHTPRPPNPPPTQSSPTTRTTEDHKLFKQFRFTHQDIAQTTKRARRKSRMGRGHWVTDTSATVHQCFSHFDEKQVVVRKPSYVCPEVSQWKQSKPIGFRFQCKLMPLDKLSSEAVKIEQCTRLDHELW